MVDNQAEMSYAMSMKYEIVIRTKGLDRVVATTRRENGAINERDRAADSEYQNKRKRGGRAVRGSVAGDPNAVAIVWYDDIATIVTIVTYRRVPPEPIPDTLADDLLASIYAIDMGARL